MRGHTLRRAGGWTAVYDVGRDENGRRKQKWKSGFPTRKAAESFLREALGKVERGDWIEPSKVSLGAYLTEWLGNRDDIADLTRLAYERVIRTRIAPTALGQMQLSAIRGQHVRAHEREMRDAGLAPATRRKIRAVIAKALSDAVDDHLLTASPVGRRLREDRKTQPGRFRCWTPRELAALLEVTDQDARLSALWRVLVATGCRRSEALGLQWLGFSAEQATLTFASQVIPTKGGAKLAPLKTAGAARTVSLDPTTVSFLERHREAQLRERDAAESVYVDNDLVFATPLGGVLRPEVVTRMFHVHRAAAGLPAGRLHDVRHSVASLWLSRGVPIVVVSARLGHASATTTLRVYSHVLDRDDARAAAMMADIGSL